MVGKVQIVEGQSKQSDRVEKQEHQIEQKDQIVSAQIIAISQGQFLIAALQNIITINIKCQSTQIHPQRCHLTRFI